MKNQPRSDGLPIVIYVRVSSVEQAAGRPTLDVQEKTCRAYAASRWPEREVIVIQDLKSARRGGRRGYRSLVSQCKAGKVFAVVTQELSRLWRCARDALTMSVRLQEWAVHLVIVSLGIDTTTPAGKLMLGMMALLAEWESDLISERTLRAQRYHKSLGYKGPGRRPYGWQLIEGSRVIERRSAEQAVIDRVLGDRAGGLSWGVIAASLTLDQIYTATGREWDASGLRIVMGHAVARRAEEGRSPAVLKG